MPLPPCDHDECPPSHCVRVSDRPLCSGSVLLEKTEWHVVLKNLEVAALKFEDNTGKRAGGLWGLVNKIGFQIQQNKRISG